MVLRLMDRISKVNVWDSGGHKGRMVKEKKSEDLVEPLGLVVI